MEGATSGQSSGGRGGAHEQRAMLGTISCTFAARDEDR
jgi:hypothetical protein